MKQKSYLILVTNDKNLNGKTAILQNTNNSIVYTDIDSSAISIPPSLQFIFSVW